MFRPVSIGLGSACLVALMVAVNGCGGRTQPIATGVAGPVDAVVTAPSAPASAANATDGAGQVGATDVALQPGATMAFGAVEGNMVVARSSGSVWGLSEDFAIMFPSPITQQSYTVTTSPASSSGTHLMVPVEVNNPTTAWNHLLEVRWSKEPGVSYTVTVKQGSKLIVTAVVNTNANMATPAPPAVSKVSDPYYYGSLEHDSDYPFGIKLPDSGAIDPRALSALTAQHVHFIRFGPSPDEIAYNTTGAQSRENYSFGAVDPAIDTLHANNITVLYDINVDGAPPWGNKNAVGDSNPIFETPALYAEYCGGVAKHLAASMPWVTRVEIGTNEPNFSYNWQNDQAKADGMPQYADATGYGWALYAKACYSAIKAVAPKISVVGPGITIGGNSYPADTFVDHIYANGCRVGNCFDILSVHSYTWINPTWPYDQNFMDSIYGSTASPGTLLSYREVQQHAVAGGETSMPPMIITETGFSSYMAAPDGVAQQIQAYFMSKAFNMYLSDPTVKGVVWADIVNHETVPGLFYGISTLDQSNNPKASWYTYRTFATY